MSKFWFRRLPPPRRGRLRPISWQGAALLVGGILLSNVPVLLVPWLGMTALLAWLVWFPICLAILFELAARRTKN
jgi:hypothetical protein